MTRTRGYIWIWSSQRSRSSPECRNYWL